MTHPFTRLAAELTARYGGSTTVLTAESLVAALHRAVAEEVAEQGKLQDRVSPEEFAFPPTAKASAPIPMANLGLATNRELFEELRCRGQMSSTDPGYRTVDPGFTVTAADQQRSDRWFAAAAARLVSDVLGR